MHRQMKQSRKYSSLAPFVSSFVSFCCEKYDDIFTALGADLAVFAGQLGSIASTAALTDSAELIISRDVAGVTQVFTIYLMRGADGIWRIDSM